RCDGGKAFLATAWTAQEQHALLEQLRELPRGEQLAALGDQTFTRFSTELERTYRASCEATSRGEQSGQRLDAQMRCLQRQLLDLSAKATLIRSGEVSDIAALMAR